jgi:L-alanine-DL-glutamate epimerase-like enolase superfamily enzyme
VGFGLEMDINNLKTMRNLIGDDRLLMIDANQGWRDAAEALTHLKRYVDFNIYFIEEPVSAELLIDLKKIKESGIVSVAGGENTYGRVGFKDIFFNEALNILQPDITKTGGFSECYPVCRMAAGWGLDYAPHMFGTAVGEAASLQVMASIPDGLFMEVDANPNPLRTELLSSSSFQFEDGGFVLVHDMPGLGITPNMDFIKEYERAS